MDMLPLRRDADLIVRELADETLIYDRERHKAHCLNRAAAFVWRHCDGHTSVAQMATLLHDEFKTPADEHLVWLALQQLQKARLLQERIQPPLNEERFSRRDLVRKLGVAAAVPLVMTILAPTASAAGSLFTCSSLPNACTAGTCPPGKRCVRHLGICQCL